MGVDVDALEASCSRFLNQHGRRRPATMLAEMGEDIEPDWYGDGGVVTELETEVAGLLGMPAALFLPSGTMAQQATLRVHADRKGRRTVGWHPTCHLALHEGQGYQRLHGLVGRPVGDARRLLTRSDLDAVAEPLAALVVELPQREIGGRLPDWDDLVAQVAWARGGGAAAHLDGARLWECTPHYGRPPAALAGLFDTVYVSFYKGLGGLGGCCVAGPTDVVAQVREWRRRQGGTLWALWPLAASALAALRRRLPLMPRYVEHAQAVAAAVRGLDGVLVVPDPPPTPLLHLHLRTSAADLAAAVRRVAAESGIWTWRACAPTDNPAWQRVELTVGDATLTFTPGEVRDLLARLVAAPL